MQCPPWASTGPKNATGRTSSTSPNWSPHTVNTVPEKTLDAIADHGLITGDTVTGRGAEMQEVFDKLEAVGPRPDRRVHLA